jgi:tRNA nucleotidyltransferase (CCA-adding enzyme)
LAARCGPNDPAIKLEGGVTAVKLILTHENADFDAVASQLAAHMLEPAAIPVLPRRVNYNVRDFLTLYRSALPHVNTGELPRQPVESVIVVDTQSVVTVKGMRPQTPAHIIDHHPPQEPLPEYQTFWGEPLGATTTLLVEQIREAGLEVSPVEATLLALGIYEDTGSMLYGTTTARDVTAAAWLLTREVDLDVVRRFLQHPLNDEQRELYELLVSHAATLDVHGHPVVIAAAAVPQPVEQISTVAHRLRDLLEPSALFTLVQMGTRVQVVARSGVDEIDVGRIAEALGGGGHRRAAAAMIEDATYVSVRERLERLLISMAQPSVTVADLMSTGAVQVIPAETPIREVSVRMQRSGHEGYPVVDEGRLVGLLTRHAVDRAMSHKLGDRPVGQIMESGHVVVRTSDSLNHLQRVMMRSGWGQIPVVDETDEMIGIVTRTDLINHWGQPEDDSQRRTDIVRRLETALPPSLLELVRAISNRAQQMDLRLYVVGGFVRDLLLDRSNTDIDLVVEGDAIRLVRMLVKDYGGSMRKHHQFGTATWLLDEELTAAFGSSDDWPEFLDFVTARSEFYENPTALPTVSQSSIKLDLHRRDFSINTLAIRLAPEPFGHLLDFWGGARDLQAGSIRALHSLSFVDDPTRILRAARFEQRFDFTIEARTVGLIEGALPFLDRVSGPRLRHEIELIFREAFPERVLQRLQALGVLAYLSSHLVIDDWLVAVFESLRQARQSPPWPDPGLETRRGNGWLLALFVALTCRLETPEAVRLGRRLQVKRKTIEEMKAGCRIYHKYLPLLAEQQRPSQVVQMLDGLGKTGMIVTWAIAPNEIAREQIVQYMTNWRDVRHTMTGEELLTLGLTPGPAYGQMLWRLRRAWLDDEVTTPAEERALAARLMAGGWGDDDNAG